MSKYLSKAEYEEQTAKTRDERMKWWREARFGMFIHFGLYSVLKRHEWVMAIENIPVEEYEKLADGFLPEPGAPRKWAELAKKAGMKYMVMTTRHHEGFSLWDSKANPYNSVNYGPKRDIVREFVDACREFDLGIGFYTSLMDWHHPDGGIAGKDSEARARFNAYITALNEELLTQYGKIDILWYDVPAPMTHWEGWNSLERNQRMRELQPHIIINNRSQLDEDFGTPEERVDAMDRDWEACMTFNGLSWGYLDSEQTVPYSYNAQGILRMLNTCAAKRGNLLLNIGPAADGKVPPEAIEPLTTVGKWLGQNGECAYGELNDGTFRGAGSGIAGKSAKGNALYLWFWVWPDSGELSIGSFVSKLKKVSILSTGEEIPFEQEKYRIKLKNLPRTSPDKIAGVTVMKLEFDEPPKSINHAATPALNNGREFD